MGIRRRRRDLSCLKDGVRGNGQIIENDEGDNITFRGGYGRKGGRGGGRGRGGRNGRRGMKNE